ncbi:hypothetical protein [Legionella jordanis]|uniref:Uncharacterized protein n=1 Tax=Legionella jordanis TaxID=456 RepID=A0A0W0VAN5_9GAMM|nr:hypothetical protein [Legionella jordanis]KTD17195.1 hypothetical protein Ljor_1501 [Legionella jordanis]RMX03315.1 hypothetical protein EAW55_07815 [Legionella jordanis]RMX18293.1 hypothetical protein EAS68_09350 [Legionella jordanis]VEH12607.1 Uncharacterised protein [Legionella jordanis]HAT8713319.1 hypothetical protein [Legionella jordanis]
MDYRKEKLTISFIAPESIDQGLWGQTSQRCSMFLEKVNRLTEEFKGLKLAEFVLAALQDSHRNLEISNDMTVTRPSNTLNLAFRQSVNRRDSPLIKWSPEIHGSINL